MKSLNTLFTFLILFILPLLLFSQNQIVKETTSIFKPNKGKWTIYHQEIYQYNQRGNLIKYFEKEKDPHTHSILLDKIIAYDYDEDGNIIYSEEQEYTIFKKYLTSKVFETDYDLNNNKIQEKQYNYNIEYGVSNLDSEITKHWFYNELGCLESYFYGPDTFGPSNISYSYYDNCRIKEINYHSGDPSSVVRRLHYQYSPDFLKVKIIEEKFDLDSFRLTIKSEQETVYNNYGQIIRDHYKLNNSSYERLTVATYNLNQKIECYKSFRKYDPGTILLPFRVSNFYYEQDTELLIQRRDSIFSGGVFSEIKNTYYDYYCDRTLKSEIIEDLNDLFVQKTEYQYQNTPSCESQSEEFYLKISPNPANGILILELPYFKNPETILQLFATNGALIFQKNFLETTNHMTLDIFNIPSGFYLLKVQNGSQVLTKKLRIMN